MLLTVTQALSLIFLVVFFFVVLWLLVIGADDD